MRNIAIGIAACLLQVFLAAPVCAQAQIPDEAAPSDAKRLGALRLWPTLVLVGPGVDTNVFNQYDQPQEDWTARVAPKSDWWLKMGRGSLVASTELEYVYFAKFDSQRSVNGDLKGKLALSLGHFIPYLSGGYTNTRERQGYEIDVRARQINQAAAVGGDVRLSDRTSFTFWGTREMVSYDREDSFLGTSLSRALDRTTNGWHVEARRRVLSLTTVLVRVEGLQDRFDTSHFRDADSLSVKPGVQFKPAALISGEALVGYRQFRPLSPLVPEFKGLVASLQLTYTYSATRLGIRLARDVQYSYDPITPYYLLTDVAPSITQMIASNWDIGATASWQRLAYQPLASEDLAAPNVAGRTDKGFRASAGFGRWFGRTLRVGIEGSYEQRRSVHPGLFNYDRLLAGVSVKYGLKP